MMNEEIWKDVPAEFFILEASNTGKVRWKNNQKPIAEYTTKAGYRCANMKPRIHQLIAAAFYGLPVEGLVVNHKDLNKLNNTPENLEYITSAENNKHAREQRKKFMLSIPIIGEEIGNTIIQLYKNGIKITEISKNTSIHRSNIYSFLVSKNIITPKKRNIIVITKEQREEIIKQYNDGKTAKNIAENFNIPPQRIYDLLVETGSKKKGRGTTSVSPNIINEIKTLWLTGNMTMPDIGRKFNLASSHVRYYLRCAGLLGLGRKGISGTVGAGNRKITFEQAQELREARKSGKSYYELEREYGLGRNSVRAICRNETYKTKMP